MKSIVTLLLSATFAATAFAGPAPASSAKGSKYVQPIAPPQGCECFAPGMALGLFGAGMFPRHGGEDVAGGGVLAEYFFTENIGLQGSYGLFATSSEHHQFDGSIVLRAPIKSLCMAPYVLAGGGVGSNGSTRGDYHVGAGIEARFGAANCMGVFADGTYHFATGDETDFTIARLGVKFRF